MKQCLMMLLGLCWIIVAQAQQQDYSNVSVDQLSEAQVTRLIEEADKRGLSDEQLLQSLGQRGMSPAEQQKLKVRIDNKRMTMQQAPRSNDIIERTGEQGRQVAGETDPLGGIDLLSDAASDTSRVFGSKLFRNTDIRFEPNSTSRPLKTTSSGRATSSCSTSPAITKPATSYP